MINRRIGEVLDEFSLADLADPRWLRDTAKEFHTQVEGVGCGE
jgi:hypothetical protein